MAAFAPADPGPSWPGIGPQPVRKSDALFALSGLNASQRSSWDERGWLLFPGLVIDHISRLDRWAREIEAWATNAGPGLHHFEATDHGERLARCEDFAPHHPGMAQFLQSSPIVDVLRLLFEDDPVLFKEKINYKHPGGAGFAPHQDAPAYRFGGHHISAMVPLDPTTQDRGCLWFADGHRGGLIPRVDGRLDPEWVAGAIWYPVEAVPGDVLLFDSLAPHSSDTNRSRWSRRILYLTYNAARDGEHRSRYYADKRSLLASLDDDGASPDASARARVRLSVSDDFLGGPVVT